MALDVDNGRGVDAAAVYHNGKVAEYLSFLASGDSHCLSGTYAVAHVHEVLCVVAVYSLQSVAVSDNDDVAQLRLLACKTYRTVEHRLYGVALSGCYLHIVVLAHNRLAHRQGERVFGSL